MAAQSRNHRRNSRRQRRLNNIKIECLKVDTTGIGAVEADDNDKAEYYNLQGIRVENPESGIYIMRRGGKTTKVIF